MRYGYLVLLIALANDLFYVLPTGARLPGGGNVSDLGILLIILGLGYYVGRGSEIKPLDNFFTWYVVLYLLLIGTQVAVAAFKYTQPIMDGIVAGRHQLYYLAFPLFLLALDDLHRIETFMKAISPLVFAILVLAIVHYGGVTIFHHDKIPIGGEVGERGGMIRVNIPGMYIIVIASLWQFWSYLRERRVFSGNLLMFFVSYSALLLRQTRAQIISVSVVLAMMMVAKKRYRALAAATALVTAVLIVNVLIRGADSAVVYAFKSAYSEMIEGAEGGTWAARMAQIEKTWNLFVANFFTGSGASVVSRSGTAFTEDLRTLTFLSDLGYWIWLKSYGLWGFLYLGAMVFGFYGYVLRCGKLGEPGYIGQFAAYHFLCILISMVTLNYLLKPEGIIMLCLTWALIVKATQTAELDTDSQWQS